MPRVFACLAVGELLVLGGAAALGMLAPKVAVPRHVALAVFALLLSCLIQTATFTYFTISGKTMAQAVHLGGLDLACLNDVQRLKRSFTYLLAAVVGAVVVVTATGAMHWQGRGEGWAHLLTAFGALVVHAGGLVRQYLLVGRQSMLLEETLYAYRLRRPTGERARAGAVPIAAQTAPRRR